MKDENINNIIWAEQDSIIRKESGQWSMPNAKLKKVKFVEIRNEKDFDKIPKSGGVYWIETNEPVEHLLHNDVTPCKNNDFEIIYNGLAKDDIRSRIKKHLLRGESDGWSAISIDILLKGKDPKSHTKKAMATKGKVPYINGEQVRNLELLEKFHLSEEEKKFVEKSNKDTFYFHNGINCLTNTKHNVYVYKVYFIANLCEVYASFIEKTWRERFGRPRLCSYKSGR